MPNLNHSRITVFGAISDHPLFERGLSLNDTVRRVDLEIDYTPSYQKDGYLDVQGIRLIPSWDSHIYPPFHSCGGRIDIEHLTEALSATTGHILDIIDRYLDRTGLMEKAIEKLGIEYQGEEMPGLLRSRMNLTDLFELGEEFLSETDLKRFEFLLSRRENVYTSVSSLTCLSCHENLDVKISNWDYLNKQYGWDTERSEVMFPPPLQVSPTIYLKTRGFKHFVGFRKEVLDKLSKEFYDTSATLESILEKLFPNVPVSVMERLLRDFTEKLNLEISDLEREVSIGTFGKSTAEAVASFTFSDAISGTQYIFKIMKNKKTADKEVLILTEAQKSLPLALYLPRLSVEEPLAYNGYYLIAMEHLRGKTPLKDKYKDAACRFVQERGKAVPEKLMHRFYVISLFHTALGRLAGHPLLRYNEAPRYYYPCQSLEESLLEYPEAKKMRLKIDEEYNTAVAYRLAYNHERGLVVHGDTVQRNWVSQHLIDFGSACAADSGGGIHRDIARIILSTITPEELQSEFMKRCVDSYYAFRDFEEQSTKAARTEQEMKIEYAHFFAELEVEAYRRLRTLGKRLPPSHFIPELERHVAIATLAGREFKEYLKA